MPLGVWGFSKRMRPASGSGFTAMIFAPRSFAFSSALNMRGWFVPGFCPATISRSASCMSVIETVPLPMPRVWVSADPLDSWHMLEQSGRLFVPSPRTSNW